VLLGAVFVGATVNAISRDRAEHQLDLAASAARSAIGALCQQLRATASAVTLHPAEQRAPVAAELAGRDHVTAVRITGPAGAEQFVTAGAPPLPWADCGQPPSTTGPPFQAIAARVGLPDGTGEVWAATRLDQYLADQLTAAAGATVTVVDLTGTDPATAAGGEGRRVRRLAPTDGQPLRLLVSVPGPDPTGLYALLTGVVAVAGGLAMVAAWRLARSTTRPLGELARAADRVAEGDLSVRVPVRSGDEVGRLATTFNRMAHRTQSYVQALTVSRDQLRRHMAVLGDTLSSAHDLDRILQVTLQTALAATSARSGAVLLVDQSSGALVGHASAGPGQEEVPVSVPVGDGLLGSVAATGEPRRGRIRADGPTLHPAEPRCRTYVVVPISGAGGMATHAAPWPAPPGVRGVLALYDRLGADEFDDTDLVTLRTFAGQAGVAVDNVRTHEEAQRLSLTDPLTGLWNYRYLKESMRREVERASRFHHQLAVLTLDLDHFKDVNDGYGHPAGDAVLTEFARRIRSEVREVDLAFRQGGEEFVVLLPETDARGATVLAQRLGAAVREHPIVITPRGSGPAGPVPVAAGQVPIRVTTSIGIAVYPEHALTPHALLDAADDALYAAKAAGRDTYRVATAGPAPVAAAELPVRASARIPEDDLPHAGGAQPPRQTRGR
jgi:diguanylate cyclase (GGDEF)-like protein